jgi:hypothetical protein
MRAISQKLFVLSSAGLLLLTGCNGTETTSSTTGTETTTTTTETATSPASSPVASPVAADTNASPVANSATTETKTTTTETTTNAPATTGTDATNTATAPATTGTDATNTAAAPATGTDTASTTTTTTTTTTTNEIATTAEAKKGGQAVKFANYHLELVTAPQDTGTKVDFYLLASDAGTAIADATVTATVKTPSGETKEVAMTYDTATESYTATLPDTAAGSYEVAVSSQVKEETVKGNFTVQR